MRYCLHCKHGHPRAYLANHCELCKRPFAHAPSSAQPLKVGPSLLRPVVPLHERHGVPINVNDWTVEDWRDLHAAIQDAIQKIAARHRAPNAELREPEAGEKL